MYGIWPEDNRRERAMFQKLKEAYTKARYSPEYKVSEEELDWLGAHVAALHALVKTVCEERLAPPDQ